MEKALPNFVAEVIGDQCQRHHPDHVRGEGDGDDQQSQRKVPEPRRELRDVDVEDAHGFQHEEGSHAGAGICHQQLIRADLDDDARVGYWVSKLPENLGYGDRDAQLDELAYGVHDEPWQRNHEEKEEDRKLEVVQERGAADQQDGTGNDEQERPDFGVDNSQCAASDEKHRTESQYGPGEHRTFAGWCGGVQFVKLPPSHHHQPSSYGCHDRAMTVLPFAPQRGVTIGE